MELTKTKYKQTEIGLIPEDWEVNRFGDIVYYTKGYPFKSKDYKNNGIRIIRVSDTTYDSINDENAVYIDAERINEFKKWMLKENDLIFSTVGSKPPMYDSLVGKSILISKKYSGSLLNQNAVIIRSKNNSNIIQNLLLNHCRSKRYINFIEEVFRGNANQASITIEDLFKFQVPLPTSTYEQKAIAEVLSDVDSLIQAIEQKLAKKRAIKQGAMQKLLTPPSRTSGQGKEDWEVKRLGEIAHIKTGSKNNQDKEEDGRYPFFVRSQTVERINSYSYDGEAILIPGEGGIGSIYHYINGKFDVHQRVYKISEFSKDVSGKFIYLYMMKNFYSHAMKNSVKATVDSLRLPTFIEFEVWLPKLQEQVSIATILSDMDKEIELIKQQLAKYQVLKQGLMQELLTGRIRLTV